jgi:hypothetical protein
MWCCLALCFVPGAPRFPPGPISSRPCSAQLSAACIRRPRHKQDSSRELVSYISAAWQQLVDMSAVYAFGSNLHDAFDLGDDILQVDRPTKLKHHTLIQANWSQAIYRKSCSLNGLASGTSTDSDTMQVPRLNWSTPACPFPTQAIRSSQLSICSATTSGSHLTRHAQDASPGLMMAFPARRASMRWR